MMKKNLYKILGIFLIAIVLTPTVFKAETLKDYQDKLAAYKREVAKNNANANNADKEMNAKQKEVADTKVEFVKNQEEVEQMQKDYDNYNTEIKDKSLQSKKIFEYLQMSNGENLYLEYALGADNMTDFIYRMSAVEQLIDYNNLKIKELEDMIEKNKAREKEIAVKNDQLKVLQSSLIKKIDQLGNQKSSYVELSVTAAEQVEIYEEIVKGYIREGCKPQHVIGVDCAKTGAIAGFIRPVTNGYVTSEVGYRCLWNSCSFHRGLDISSKTPYATTIYPVANGTVKSVYTDKTDGARIVIIQHRTFNGQYYTSLYAHMSSFADGLRSGKAITTSQPIGTMGGSGKVTGPHLHLEIWPCRLYDTADKNCNTWNNYDNYAKSLFDSNRSKGVRSVINLPSIGVTFNSR